MEVFEGRPQRKRLSPQELADLDQERQLRHQEKLAVLSSVQKEKVKNISGDFEESLVQYLGSPGADPQILERINGFIGHLGNALMYAGDLPSTRGRKADVEASLLGASLVLDVSRETRFDIDQEQLPLVQRFLSLVGQRVAKLAELNERRL